MEIDAAQSFAFLAAELVLAASIVAAWVVDGRGRSSDAGLLGATLAVVLTARLHGWGEVWVCERLLVVDGLAVFAKLVIGLAVVATLWIERSPACVPRQLAAGLAAMIVASAANAWVGAAALVAAFLAASPHRTRLLHAVAGISTVSILASLGGLSGLAGSADFEALRSGLFDVLPRHGFAIIVASSALLAATILWLGAIASRLDTLADGPIVAVALPAATLTLVARLFFGALSEPSDLGRWLGTGGLDWRPPLATGAAVAIVWGSSTTLRAQTHARLLGGSSIVVFGHALAGLASSSAAGLRAALFLAGGSSIAMIGAFLVASRGRTFLTGALLAVFLGSIAAGGRGPLLAVVIARGEPALAGLAALGVASLALAYARVLRVLLARRHELPLPRPTAADLCGLAVLGAATIANGIWPQALLRFAGRSATLLPF